MLAQEWDLSWLIGKGPYTAQNHLSHRLINALVARKEQHLEVGIEAMTPDRKQHHLDLTVKSFMLKRLQIYAANSTNNKELHN